MKSIDFAIDLGTTNSLIGKHEGGKVQLFKNAKGFNENLPSVVAYRKNGVLIGNKAKELKDRDPQNVFSSFKRKMGTDESYFVPILEDFVSPIDLSTHVLNELRTFVREESMDSVVITIPASFDTIQSNATKEAGLKAGFKEVVLLQEPIAACLTAFNEYSLDKKEGKWLIYDLGGGTFDVALVDVNDEELKVIDHLGNNFLGGLDFDIAIVKELMLTQIREQGEFEVFNKNINENTDSKNVLPQFNFLLFFAEQLKIDLTSYTESFVDFQLKDDNDVMQDIEIKITRDQFNGVIDQSIGQTVTLVRELLKTNGLNYDDLNEILMVGGSTYIPYVKEKLEKELNIEVNRKLDPSTAIAIGAGFYAGNKESKLVVEKGTDDAQPAFECEVTPIYQKQSREKEEIVIFKSTGELENKMFRVYRKDLGYDSGKRELHPNDRLILPLLEKRTNDFQIEIYDSSGGLLVENAGEISINQGLYIIDGQPIPNDICLEIDDVEGKETMLEPIFEKNSILPLSKTIYKMVSRNILQNSDEGLIINILEGDRFASPTTNQVIGSISIMPKEIGFNLIKDSDICITLTVTEDRDLKVNASISMIDYEIENIFKPTQRTVNPDKLREELRFLIHQINKEFNDVIQDESYETAEILKQMKEEAEDTLRKIGKKGKIAGDIKFNVEETKRQISVRLDKFGRTKKISEIIESYQDTKEHFLYSFGEDDMADGIKNKYNAIVKQEAAAIAAGNVSMIRHLIRKMDALLWEAKKSNVNYLKSIYYSYNWLPPEAFTDLKESKRLFEKGDELMEKENLTKAELMPLLGRIYALVLPEFLDKDEDSGFDLKGTGIQ